MIYKAPLCSDPWMEGMAQTKTNVMAVCWSGRVSHCSCELIQKKHSFILCLWVWTQAECVCKWLGCHCGLAPVPCCKPGPLALGTAVLWDADPLPVRTEAAPPLVAAAESAAQQEQGHPSCSLPQASSKLQIPRVTGGTWEEAGSGGFLYLCNVLPAG